MTSGHIYLVNMADLIKNVYYKIGKSINVDKRIKKYDYANIVSIVKSDNIDYDESELLKIFNKNCTLDKGREYFTGESDEFMLKLFIDYFINKKCESKTIKVKKGKEVPEVQEVQEVKEVQKVPEGQEVPEVPEVSEVPEVQEVNEIIKNTIVCPNMNCKIKFKFNSLLKKHLNNSYHCSKDINDIDEYILNNKNNKSLKIIKCIKCIKCNITYTRQSSLNRHINNSICYDDKKNNL